MSGQDSTMNRLEHEVMTAIVSSFGATIFDLITFLGLTIEKVYAQAELKLGLLGLCKKKYVRSMKKIAGERVFCVPYERYIEHMNQLSIQQLSTLMPMKHADVAVDEWGHDLVMEVIILLSWVRKDNPHLNKKGLLDKKQIEAIMKCVQLNLDRLTPLMDTNKLPYPLTLAILIDFTLRLGLILIHDGSLQADEQRITRWLEQSPTQLRLQLYHLWFQVHYPEQQLARQLLVLLPLLRAYEWFTIQQLFNNEQEIKLDQIEQLLSAMQELGWVQLGRTIDGSRAILSLLGVNDQALTSIQEQGWYVQPDFEIIVSPKISYTDHYQFNSYATPRSRNQMYIYELTKSSVIKGFQQGWTVDQIINHLLSQARYGVPENIQLSIAEWGTLYRGVQLETVTLLRCESVAIANQLTQLPEIAGILNEQRRLQPNLFLILDDEVDFIRERMNTYGYQTDNKRVAQHNRNHTSPLSSDNPNQGIFHSPLRYDMYTDDELYTEVVALYPGFADIPSGWMNTYVSYHMTTRKQLLLQSIEWQCYVQVEHEGKAMIIAPQVIELEDMTPVLICLFRGKLLKIPLISLEAMRLILPGIHDI